MNLRKGIYEAFERAGRIMSLGYDAGESSRVRQDIGWERLTPRDEDSLTGNDLTLERIRQKLMDASRNNPIVSGFGPRVALWCLGNTGLRPQVHTDDDVWNEAAESWFNEIYWNTCDSRGRCSMYDFQQQAVSLRPIMGGLYFEKVADGTLRPIEPERIRNPEGRKHAKLVKQYRNGVRVDSKTGRVIAYRVHGRDENGSFTGKHEENDVAAGNMIPVIRPDWRPDQLREMPDLASIVPFLQDIHELNRNSLNTAKVQSGIIGFLKKAGGGANAAGARGTGQAVADVGARKVHQFDWGQVLTGVPGEDLELKSSATPNSNHIPHVKMHLMLCASATGFPYEFFTLDMSSLDFSRQKGMLLLVNYAVRPWKLWLQQRFMRRVWNWRIGKETQLGGALYPPPTIDGVSQWDKVSWQGAEEPWSDRQEAQQSDILEIQSGLGQLELAARRRGGDLETNIRSNARALKKIAKIAEEEGVDAAQLFKMQIPGQTGAIQKQPDDKRETRQDDTDSGKEKEQ